MRRRVILQSDQQDQSYSKHREVQQEFGSSEGHRSKEGKAVKKYTYIIARKSSENPNSNIMSHNMDPDELPIYFMRQQSPLIEQFYATTRNTETSEIQDRSVKRCASGLGQLSPSTTHSRASDMECMKLTRVPFKGGRSRDIGRNSVRPSVG